MIVGRFYKMTERNTVLEEDETAIIVNSSGKIKIDFTGLIPEDVRLKIVKGLSSLLNDEKFMEGVIDRIDNTLQKG